MFTKVCVGMNFYLFHGYNQERNVFSVREKERESAMVSVTDACEHDAHVLNKACMCIDWFDLCQVI